MTLTRLAQWLRCPNCCAPLHPTAPLTIGCDAGHRFDVNKRGYVTLAATRGAPLGDTPQMLQDRAVLLGSGAYSPVLAGVLDTLPESPRRILDAGCGTGHYLLEVLRAHEQALGLALDRSPAAVRLAVRSHERISGLVADTWEPLPIRDESADVILNVFAPRNPSEFHRVLRARGSLIVVVPRADHLDQLREAAEMLSVPADKAEHLEGQLADLFSLTARMPVRYPLALLPEQARVLRDMGPSAYHKAAAPSWVPPHSVTVSVDVLRFSRR